MKIKNILISIGLITIVAISMSASARADDSSLPLSNQQLFSKLLNGIGIDNPDYNLKLSDIFSGGEKNTGQNLYLAIYKKTVLEPEQEALKNVGQSAGLNSYEIQAVLAGSLEPIIQKHPRLSQEEIMKQARELQDRYNDFVDIEGLRSETEAYVMPSEIFANGDTSDSGFDLIDDLNNIEIILFKDVTPATVNQAYSGGLPEQPTQPPQTTQPEAQPTSPKPQQEQVQSDLTGNEPKHAETGDVLADVYQACPGDHNLYKALDDYEQKTSDNAKSPQSSGDSNFQDQGSSGGSSDGGSGGTSTPTGNQEPSLDSPGGADGDWTDKFPCGEKFCIEITTHSAKYTAYSPSDPCIACHVKKIREDLKKVVSHNLAPSKMTGNIMEMAKCKSGFSLSDFVNINVVLVPMPVITPQKNSAIFGRNIFDEFKKFVNKYTLFKMDEDRNKAAQIVDAQSSSATTQREMLDEINKILFKNKQDAEKRLKDQETLLESSLQGEFFQSIAIELDAMKLYFDIYKQLLGETNKICAKIKSKGYVE